MIKIEIKPMSVNDAWKGHLIKSDAYKVYENTLAFLLPKLTLPMAPYQIEFEFGFSSASSDWDNPIKPLQDILQKKYGFNDRDVFRGIVTKTKVRKGSEYLKFKISTYGFV